MKKRLLVIGASDFQLPAIQTAKQMGLQVAAADMNPQAVGVPFADAFYSVSTIDKEGICRAAKDFAADGIVTLCTDMPIRALAYSCKELGLIGPSEECAVTATDKGRMIQAFEKHGVSCPTYLLVAAGTDVDALGKDFTFPLITKPVDNSGSRGIMLANDQQSLREALSYSAANGRGGDVIVEEYMQGPEVSVEVMVVDGQAQVLQITDKLTTGAPHFVEIGHSQPSRLPEKDRRSIADLACRAAISVGIVNGPAHAEIILTKDGPKMVEIGARMGGGCITTHLVPLSTGINMTGATIDVALGNAPDLQRKWSKGAAIRFIIPPVGTVAAISGAEEARRIPGIHLVEIQCRVGQELRELESGACRIGYVIAQAETPEAAVTACEAALEKIKIEVE